MRRIVTAHSAEEIARLRYFWERLPSPTMFQSFDWNYTAAKVFRERETPHVIYVETDNGAALVPGAIRNSRLTLIGEELFDYRDVLLRGDHSVLSIAWSRAARLHLDFTAGALRSDGNSVAWERFQRNNYYAAPCVRRNEIDASSFASGHHRLGRWHRRLEREGVPLRCHTGDNSALVRDIYQKKGSQPAESGDSLFDDPARVEFMVQVCAAAGAACEIFTFESAGSRVAALVTFRDANWRRFYTVQFDPAWAKYSPGMVLIYEVTRRSLEAGLDCDYMTGQHAYKMRFASSAVPMFWLDATQQALESISHPREELAA